MTAVQPRPKRGQQVKTPYWSDLRALSNISLGDDPSLATLRAYERHHRTGKVKAEIGKIKADIRIEWHKWQLREIKARLADLGEKPA